MLTVAKFDRYDFGNNMGGDTASHTIWFSGCTVHCNGCHNKALWNKSAGKEYSAGMVTFAVCSQCEKLGVKDVVLLGGEPLEQDLSDLVKLVLNLKENGLNVWLYTSKEFDEVPMVIRDHIDVLKTGKYDEDLKCNDLLPTSNQKLFRKINNEWQQDMEVSK